MVQRGEKGIADRSPLIQSGNNRRLERAFEAIVHDSQLALLVLDGYGECIYLNPAAERLTGFSCDEAGGKCFHDLAHHSRKDGSPFPAEECPIGRAWTEGATQQGDSEFIHKNGSTYEVSYTARPFHGEDGSVDGTILELRVPERRQLRESEQRIREVLSIETVGVIFWNSEGRIADANSAFLRMSGRTLDEARGLSWRELTPPEFLAASERAWRELNEAGEMTPYEKQYYRKDGSIWWGLFAARKLNDREMVELVLDVSERNEAEAEVRRLNSQLELRVRDRTAELEEVNKELEAFAYSVSHDLRAPLRGVLGFSQALVEDYRDSLEGAGERYLERIRAGAERMNKLIDEMLSFSRNARADLNRTDVNLSAIAEAVAEELRSGESVRRVGFRIEPRMTVRGDERQLRVVLDNLMGNAWKFTRGEEQAEIDVGVMDQNEQKVYFVKDNGAGFSMRYADKLFMPFQRLHGREFEGTGIGLATVHRIVSKHGGKVWARSEPEKGATFFFTLN